MILRATVLAALATLASGCSPAAAPTASTPGARLYLTHCAACHRADGRGIPEMQPALAGTPVTIGDTGTLLGWVMYGRRPAALPRGAFHGVMPEFSYLSDADLAAILTHVRGSFGNQAPPVTAAMVAAARAGRRG